MPPRRIHFPFRILAVVLVLWLTAPAFVRADEATDKRIAKLEARIAELEARRAKQDDIEAMAAKRIRNLPWEPNRPYELLSNGWAITNEGEFRTRARVEANVLNNYTTHSGEQVYAYDPKSTFENDYGWWDSRILNRTVVNFGTTADLIAKLQFGDWAWGSNSPTFGGNGNDKFDKVTLQVRELWFRGRIDPIPVVLEVGRMPWILGNGLIQGNEQDGGRVYYMSDPLEAGFGSFRQYEGENYEMAKAYNDDEDTFVGWLTFRPGPTHTKHEITAFGWYNLWEISEQPGGVDPNSPLMLIPGFSQEDYPTQESELLDLGVNYRARFDSGLRLNLEYNQQTGKVAASDKSPNDPEDIAFEGFGGIAKIDYVFKSGGRIALTGGYGSGDDPDTSDYEGFFAPDHRYGIYDEEPMEAIESGYFYVYDHLAPGAGVPGRLFDDLGSGGIENTTFVNLAADSWAMSNHHFYVSLGYIEASVPNPDTDTRIIGIENDFRVDYYFNNNIIAAIYGGHLFMLGDYFRDDAHDAAIVRFEWRLIW
ncbi:hypothetical protein KDL45_09025 [bacterium]|nr:hypothetical protein [bacterium]